MKLPLGVESVGDDSAGNAIAKLISTAYRDHRNVRKAATHDREELESRHCGMLRSEMMMSGASLLAVKEHQSRAPQY